MTQIFSDTSFAKQVLFSFEGVFLLKKRICEEPMLRAYKAGIDDGEDPPVPIPNTEVKLTCAEDS